ncbi:MAG TPA: M56 family metallopeptidase [Gemmatimonadales bacterium]|nr:M56 family metallopeptidase [Gemmatimonadales bacterium]
MTTAFSELLARGYSVLDTPPLVLALVKITLVLVLGLALTAVLERASAGARHLIWLLILAALLVLPPLAFWGPLQLPVLPQAERQVPAAPVAEAIRLETGLAAHTAPQAPPVVDREGSASAGVPSLSTLLLWLWGAGALLLVVRLGYAAWAVRRVVRQARPLESPAWQTPLYEISDRLGIDRAPALLQSSEVKMPFAAGWWSTTIVLPAESESWNSERRTAVLIHELGHVRRRDLVGHTLSRMACALYWFHPLVWTAARRLRAESERACDDLALVLGTRPDDYAEHLLDIVTCVRDHNTPAIALAMAHRREFEGRMLAILNPELARRAPGRTATTSLILALGGFSLLLGAAVPVPRAQPAESRQVGAEPPASGYHGLLPEPIATPSHPLAPQPTPAPGRVEAPAQASRTTSAPTVHRTRTVESNPKVGETDQPVGDRLTALVHALRADSSPAVRRTAAWGLARYAQNDTAESALADALAGDREASVREMAAWALADARSGHAGEAALKRALREDRSPAVRHTAAWAIGQVGDPDAVGLLIPLLTDSATEVRSVAAWAIGQCGPKQAPAALVAALGDASPQVRLLAAWALYTIEDPATAPAIETAFQKESNREVQLGLLRALGAMGDEAVPTLEKLVTSPDSEVRRVAVTALAGGNASGPWPWPWPEPRPQP